MRIAWSLAAIPAVLGAAYPAGAHSFRRSFADLTPTAEGAAVLVDLDPDDFDDTLQARFDRDRSGLVDVPELRRSADMIAGIVAAGMKVWRGDTPCTPEVRGAQVLVGAQMVRADIDYRCPRPGLLRVHMVLFERLRQNHVHLMTLRLPEGAVSGALTAERPSWEQRDHNAWIISARFLRVGVEHILVGYDHLLFLLALLLVARGVRQILGIITAFTVAHSITLVAAGLGWVSLPGAVVESAIALTIVVVAVQNPFITEAGPRGRHRWLLTFGLGLVHGFGFASILGEMRLPPHNQVAPLLAFNVGVELGQLAVVLCVVPALEALRQAFVSRRATLAITVGAAAAGAALWPFEPLCAGGVWVLAAAALLAVPRLGYRWAMVHGASGAVAVMGGIWFVRRAFGA